MDSEHGQAGTTKTAPWQWAPGAEKINGCASDGGRHSLFAERTFKQEYWHEKWPVKATYRLKDDMAVYLRFCST